MTSKNKIIEKVLKLEYDKITSIRKALALKDAEHNKKVEEVIEYIEEMYIGDISDSGRKELKKEIRKIFAKK